MDVSKVNIGSEPVTLTVSVRTTGRPYKIAVVNTLGKPREYYYDRLMDAEETQIPINLPQHSETVFVVVDQGKIESVLTAPLKKPHIEIPFLDQYEERRPYELSEIRFRTNYAMTSPARMFTDKPIIEYNPVKMDRYPVPVRMFIYLHELGHQFFDDEVKTDRWATVKYLNEGYPLSMAIWSLIHVLNKNPENIDRMVKQNELLKQISRYYYG